MATVTALTLVNRLLRRHGYEDVSTLAAPEALLSLDLVNQSIRELLSERDYPWNIRSDGSLELLPTLSATDGWFVTGPRNGNASGAGWTSNQADYMNTSVDTGDTVVRVVVSDGTSDTLSSNSNTAMRVENITDNTSVGAVRLVNEHPGFTIGETYSYKFIFSEYLLPDSVSKVISVVHQNEPIRLLEVPPHSRFDEVIPRPHDYEDDNPEVVLVGGQSHATTWNTSGSNQGAVGLRMVVWPIPTVNTVLNYTYKERLSELTAATDELVTPQEFHDDVIDRAEALSNMTQRWNDPQLAQLQYANSVRTAERKWRNATLDPSRRHSLRPHDSGLRRRDPTRYRDITGLD